MITRSRYLVRSFVAAPAALALLLAAPELAAQAPAEADATDADFDALEATLEPAREPAAPPATPPTTPPTTPAPQLEARAVASPAPVTTGRKGPQSLNPDLTFIADFAAAYFSEDEPLQSGAHDPSETGFNLQALELQASSAVDPYLRFDANIVFALGGLEIEEAYGTTLDLPLGLQARFGQFLTRFGRQNPTHQHSWAFADQPFALGRVFGGEGNRGLGVEVSWLTPLPWYLELVLSATRADGEETARSFFGAESPGIEDPGDVLYVTAVKQFFPLSHDWSLAFGLSSALGPNATGRSNRSDVYGTDFYLKYRPITRSSFTEVSLQSEWLYRRRQIPDELLQDVNGYTQAFWRFARRWGVAARYEYGSASFDQDGRRFTADPLDPEWTEARHRVSANLTHWPTEFSRFRLQGARDAPGYRDDIWSLFLAAELVVGPHGAHTF